MAVRHYALLLLACACSRGQVSPDADTTPDARPAPEAAHIARVVVTSRIWPKLAGTMPDEAALGDQIGDLFGSSEAFALRDGSRPAVAVVAYGLDVGAQKDDKFFVQAAIMVKVRWERDGGDPILVANGLFETTIAKGERNKLPQKVRAHLDRGFKDTFLMLLQQEELRMGDVKAVLTALRDPDPETRIMALRYVAERELREAVPRVIELLEDKQPELRDAAIGALVAMREQSAVVALTRLARFRDVDLMRRVVDAVGSIGGQEARAYLEFVVDSHENPVIQQIAREALERLRRRTQVAGSDANAVR